MEGDTPIMEEWEPCCPTVTSLTLPVWSWVEEVGLGLPIFVLSSLVFRDCSILSSDSAGRLRS